MKKLSLIFLTVLLFSCKKETINNYYTNGPIISPNNGVIPRPSNLILNLDATNPTSNENGSIWFDLSGNNYHATLKNGAKFLNGSVLFDGYDDVATLGTIRLYSTNLTVEAWVYTRDVEMKARSIITSNTSGDFVFYTVGDNRKRVTNFGTYMNQPFNSSCLGNVDISVNGWTHYVVTYDDLKKSVKVYIDGQLNTVYSRSGVLIPNNLSIGNLATKLDEGWKGNISIIRMYNITLTDYDISNNYMKEKSKFGK